MAFSALFITGLATLLLLVFILREEVSHRKRLRQIPFRLCVTGTRGKTSVTRLLASLLRESGQRVFAKTTGTSPKMFLPDGSEEIFPRRGFPTVLEDIKFIRKANRGNAQALVTELMGIRPETLSVESLRINQPHILVITNVRLDHTEHMGLSLDRIAECFASAIPPKGIVFIPEEECLPIFEQVARRRGAKLIPVSRDLSPSELPSEYLFKKNSRLVLAVAEYLGLPDGHLQSGISPSSVDIGKLNAWNLNLDSSGRKWTAVNLFEANDPQSTREILDLLGKQRNLPDLKKVGLFNLRPDRGERTLQWLESIRQDQFSDIQEFVFLGRQSPLVVRRLRKKGLRARCFALNEKWPEKVMEKIRSGIDGDILLLGMMNMGGMGERLTSYWNQTGAPYDI
ncbi:poly-gamma-glutamate synthase PgsB [Acidobacteriota bacterium]